MASSNWSLDPEYCKSVEELEQPIQAKITGVIPKWITGTLLRNGPGKFEVGETAYRHAYDGLALLQQFVIKDGNVTYFNKFLRSQTYQTNMKAGKIVAGELGTPGVPDPCKNIFARWFSHFFPKDYTDNASVNFCCIKGKIYAITEVPIITEIDPSSLETLNRVKLSESFKGSLKQLFHSSAHPQQDEDGTVYNLNVGYDKKIGLAYVFTMIPGSNNQQVEETCNTDESEDDAKVIAVIPASRRQAYSHSFGMTEKYLIFIQQPLVVNLWKLAASPFIGCSILDTFSWDSSKSTIFHVVSRETGDVVSTFQADPFFFFHVVNAYDMDDDIIIDICCYPNSKIFFSLYLKEYQERTNDSVTGNNNCITSQLRRYQLPVKPKKSQVYPEILKPSEAQSDYKVLSDASIDLPRINEKYNRSPYRFLYGCHTGTGETGLMLEKLLKIDVEDNITAIWYEKDSLPSEPVFIASPDSQDEDEGVVLSAVYDKRNENSFLLVLDGRTFTEIGRAEVPLRFPPTFHGYFLPKNS